MISAVLIFLTGCAEKDNSNPVIQIESSDSDTVAVVFGPSLTEMFYISGAWNRVAGVDRFSTWPAQAEELAVIGDFLTPSMEMIIALGVTSIHIVGTNQSLMDLSHRLDIPYYQYSFDRLDDVYESCANLEQLYPEADFSVFTEELNFTIDSLAAVFAQESLEVMIVVHLSEDGAMTLAGKDTFYFDIITAIGCVLAAPDTGSYPAVSVEGILAINPDYVIILDPYNAGENLLNHWRSNGLDDTNVSILSGNYVLIPGARLKELVLGIIQCLN